MVVVMIRAYYKRGSIAALRLERDTALHERKKRRSEMAAKKHKDDSELDTPTGGRASFLATQSETTV